MNRWTIPGEGIQGKEYDEYVVDDDALYEKTVETFYVEKNKVQKEQRRHMKRYLR